MHAWMKEELDKSLDMWKKQAKKLRKELNELEEMIDKVESCKHKKIKSGPSVSFFIEKCECGFEWSC